MLSGDDAQRLWRVRTGDYRVIYRIEDDVLLVLVINLRHRREAYGRYDPPKIAGLGEVP